MFYRIVETDNYGGDYPNESELALPRMSKEKAEHIASAINESFVNGYRYWKVVEEGYELQPGFEP